MSTGSDLGPSVRRLRPDLDVAVVTRVTTVTSAAEVLS